MVTNSESVLKPGAILAGKYRVERILGQGGMGVVASAQHLQLEQRVALKIMLPEAVGNAEAVARFIREARAAARITSEHVARVFDVASLETGEPYIVMEYLEGADIGQLLAKHGRFSVEHAVDYLLQACEALAEAHAAGIVHRDLKPANLFVVERVDGQRLIKVLDFGISKMADSRPNGPSTRTSALMGTPLYMSPEQMSSSKHVDARSDVWALGVVLYEMLSGMPPFTADTLPQVCAMILSEPPPSLVQRSPTLPPLLYEVVARCLKKEPSARFQSVAELAQALEPIASTRARQSVERISRVQGFAAGPRLSHAVAGVTGGAPPGTNASWGETRSPSAPYRRAPVIAVASLLVLVLAGALAWGTRRSVEGAAPAPVSAPSRVAAAAPTAPASEAEALHIDPPSVSRPAPAATTAAAAVPARAPAPRSIRRPLQPALPPRTATPLSPASTAAAPAAPATPVPAPTRSRF